MGVGGGAGGRERVSNCVKRDLAEERDTEYNSTETRELQGLQGQLHALGLTRGIKKRGGGGGDELQRQLHAHDPGLTYAKVRKETYSRGKKRPTRSGIPEIRISVKRYAF